jgi:hypothetical protein
MVHMAADTNDLFFLRLAPLYKELETFRPHHSNDFLDIARLTILPHVKVTPFIEPLDRLSVRLHYGAMTEATWRPVVQHSEAVFRRIRMTRALMHIWELLGEHGCRQAARLISLALFTIKLPAGLLIEQPLTILPGATQPSRRCRPANLAACSIANSVATSSTPCCRARGAGEALPLGNRRRYTSAPCRQRSPHRQARARHKGASQWPALRLRH